MTAFLVVDLCLAVALSFVSGYLTSRRRWYDRGYRSGATWASRVGARFVDADPTTPGSRR